MRITLKTLIFSFAGTIAFAAPLIVFDFLFEDKNVWGGYTLGNAGLREEFCERNRMEAFTRERVNAWSNLAYVFYGLMCFSLFKTDRKIGGSPQRTSIFTLIAGLSFIYLGLGSFLYHASLSHFTQRLDMAATYAATVAVMGFGLFLMVEKYFESKNKNSLALFICFIIFLADILFYVFKWQIDSKIVLPLMILILLFISIHLRIYHQQRSQFILAVFAFLFLISAFTLWILDVKKILCDPDSVLQGHALWHILTGLSLILMVLYYRNFSVERSN